MTPSGAYRHAHVAQGPFFHPKMPCVITVISQESSIILGLSMTIRGFRFRIIGYDNNVLKLRIYGFTVVSCV